MALKNKYKVSAYLTDSEVKLLDSLAMQWECSKSQAIIKAIRKLTNSDNNPNPISNPIPPHSVNVGLSKENIELLIEQKIELLVNPKLEALQKPVKATEETPNDGKGLTAVALARLFPEKYGAKCCPEYLSLFLSNSSRCPKQVREILAAHWTYQARRWYPKSD